MARPPQTPDGHYLVIDGVLWRASDPRLSEERRRALVDELMAGRRAIRRAKAAGDPRALGEARERVHRAKVGLGERGPPWWDEGPVCDQVRVEDSPYGDWWAGR